MSDSTSSGGQPLRKVTASEIRGLKGHRNIAALTAYDATFSRLVDEGGIDILLVGDTLGMVVQGQPSTLGVTVDDVIYHTRAVARGASRALIVSDLSFMSYQVSVEQALISAGRLVKEGGAEAVKLEGGRDVCAAVRRIVGAGIPVMGHLGMTPQSVHAFGGYRVQARDQAARERLLDDAQALEEAGVFSIVLEAVPRDLAEAVTASIGVPTIGIGAGPACDGQVLVLYDILGLIRDFAPRFVKRYAELGDAVTSAVKSYVREVQSGEFPTEHHSYGGRKAPTNT
jgi:3-methyl-2-oxobutanoate hydroxymethyltransferase